jgi:hypothetical protein
MSMKPESIIYPIIINLVLYFIKEYVTEFSPQRIVSHYI